MRRQERQTSAEDAHAMLEKGEHGVLSTVSPDGKPYGVPLNYCVMDGHIYFHCAPEGHKLDSIARQPEVSFCVVGETRILPEKFSTAYESCIARGIAVEVFAEEKERALEGLVKKYSRAFVAEGMKYIASDQHKTRVFKIEIVSLSGKARS